VTRVRGQVARRREVPQLDPGAAVGAATGQVPPLIEMRSITKSFGRVVALDGASFEIRRGEIHALLGENGAGKTTIMNVLAGLYRADGGQILIDGVPASIHSPRDAADHAIGMVHQHFELVEVFTGLDNMLLAVEKGLLTAAGEDHVGAIQRLAADAGLEVPLDRPVGQLAVGDQQKVEILRTLYAGVDLLILDEPTTHLTPVEVDALFGVIRGLTEHGLTVVLISHKLNEVLAVADRITVLRHGRTVGTIGAGEASRTSIVEMMMGADGAAFQPGGRNDLATVDDGAVREMPREPLLVMRGVRMPRGSCVDLEVRRGEIVGVAGVAGNGQQELVEVISGLRLVDEGCMHLGGADITRTSTAHRIRVGLAVLPDDRLREAVLPNAPLYETYFLGLHQLERTGRFRRNRLRGITREVIDTYRIVTPDEGAPTATLSGGNIQKLLVARAEAIATRSADGLVLAMNPSRGLDVGAAAFLYERLGALRASGRSVLFISEDLDELMQLCDRILVLRGGALVDEFVTGDYDRYAIGASMVGAGG
jgi:general nucleoside transport system ATP-binding protein